MNNAKPATKFAALLNNPVVIAGRDALAAIEIKKQEDALRKAEIDAWFFVSNFVSTYDESCAKVRRFPRWDFLRDIVFPKLHAPGNRLWEKAQRMGLTISVCAYFFWAFMTQRNWSGWMTSRKDEKVDDSKHTWDSLFGKIRFYYDNMLREYPWVVEHFMGSAVQSDRVFSHMRAENAARGSYIYGEAPVENAPTGGGYVKAFVDETALVPQMYRIHGNLMFACPNGTHYVSYPDGMNNHFAVVRHTSGHFGFEIVTIPYHFRPEHDPAWLEAQRRSLTEDDFGRRVMISYSTSVRGRVWPRFSRDRNTINSLRIDPYSLMLWFDFGFVDATSVGIVQVTATDFGGEVKSMVLVKDWLEVNFTAYDKVARMLRDKLATYGITDTTRLRCIGDPQVKQRSVATGKSIHDQYSDVGFVIEAAPQHDTKATLDEIDKWMSEGRVVIDSDCILFIETCENWKWPSDARGNIISSATQPEHSRYSHAGKAFEYGFAALFMRGRRDEKTTPLVMVATRTEREVYGNIL